MSAHLSPSVCVCVRVRVCRRGGGTAALGEQRLAECSAAAGQYQLTRDHTRVHTWLMGGQWNAHTYTHTHWVTVWPGDAGSECTVWSGQWVPSAKHTHSRTHVHTTLV
jgi:hypothetical protein